MQDSENKARTPSETIINAMETFSESEPKSVIVIWTDEDGGLNWSSSSDSISTKLGMIEMVKAWILNDMIQDGKM